MKKINVLIAAILMIASYSLTAQVAITPGGGSADASALLDLQSTDKGFLPPRMTSAQMGAITSPAEGLIVYCTDCSPKGPYYYDGGGFLNFVNNTMSFSDVTNPATGEIWMDRNLGATQAASSSTDAASYGDLYQWGRADEGHEIRSSGLTSTNATTAVPNLGSSWDGLFITESSSPYDWLTTQDNTLWQGVSGTNNPCPTGYRLPTEAEWEAERASWSSNNATGAFASPLKLPVAGARDNIDGSLDNAGSDGYYLSSNISGIYSRSLYFISGNAFMNSTFRAYGFSVRCIKD